MVAAAVALALVAGLVLGWRWVQDRDRTELERAMGLAPADAQRFSWTDWAAVRAELDADVSAGSSAEEVTAFLDAGFDADLTSTSALVESAAVLQESFGLSPATVEWELFSQSEDGDVVILGLDGEAAVAELADRLRVLDYEEPEEPDGVWDGSEAVVRLGGVTPLLSQIRLDADEGLVRAGSDPAYVEGAEAAGEVPAGLGPVVERVGGSLSAAVYDGPVACERLAMSQADTVDQQAAESLVAAAGDVSPMTGFAMAERPGGAVVVAMSFDEEDQAWRNADSRATLATGPAPGQGGDFAERFELTEARAEGQVVLLDLEPAPGAFVLSDLSNGPVLFATC